MAVKTATLSIDNSTPKERYNFIDLYRTAIILLMIEGHVFRTFIPSHLKNYPIFLIHEFIHGLTAPAFLFGAGLTFIISTSRRWDDYHHWGQPLKKRLRKLILIILLGYVLHLPYLSLKKIINEATTNEILSFFQFDILHTIGIGLLSLHAIIFFFKKETRFYLTVFIATLAVCLTTPLIWEINFYNYLPPFLSQMFNGNQGSPFPLFPYIGFLFAGTIVSWEFLVATQSKKEKEFMYKLANIGMILIILSIIFDKLPFQIYPTYNYWYTSPNYFLLRAGLLMVLISLFMYLSEKIKKLKKIFTILGVESLFVYVAHLIILYGSVINPTINLQRYFGVNLAISQTFLIFFALLALMFTLALLWNHLKEKHNKIYRVIQFVGGGIFFVTFIFNPY